jgi:hypothetical protein
LITKFFPDGEVKTALRKISFLLYGFVKEAVRFTEISNFSNLPKVSLFVLIELKIGAALMGIATKAMSKKFFIKIPPLVLKIFLISLTNQQINFNFDNSQNTMPYSSFNLCQTIK